MPFIMLVLAIFFILIIPQLLGFILYHWLHKFIKGWARLVSAFIPCVIWTILGYIWVQRALASFPRDVECGLGIFALFMVFIATIVLNLIVGIGLQILLWWISKTNNNKIQTLL
jgi:predicted Na+-dependent transporter